ncbi:MAG: hypothetical protein BGO26_10145 [Actinobacteria bacterium 69-20]|mgnify:CR=1 FL=1|nr:DUF4326 domain-containing protein [Actinomycetota bacterium]OJV23259.1 MAG: hypothetical protein BGO26_10145 [Actinobacteria bacterium 69-20]
MPERIQMSRSHPWRAEHPDAVIVDRRTKWGNPFKIGRTYDMWVHDVTPKGYVENVTQAVELFRQYTHFHFVPIKPETRPYHGIYTYGLEPLASHARRLLAGRDLACWCPLDQPCHADVLLALANPTPAPAGGDAAPTSRGGHITDPAGATKHEGTQQL